MDLVTGHMHLFQRPFHQQELVHWGCGVCFESALSLALRLAKAVERESSYVPHRRTHSLAFAHCLPLGILVAFPY